MRTATDLFGLPLRQRNGCGGICRDRNREAMPALLPIRNNRPIGRVVLGVKLRKCSIEMRMNGEVMIARPRSIGINAGGAAIDPRHHRAKRVMVIGVHTRVSGVSIPALPPRRSALLHHVTP